jgi:predicted RNA polymerase sigma factor
LKPLDLQEKNMAASSRREKIEAMLAEEPGDQFLRYGLAVELDKDGDHERSLAMLSELGRDEVPYVPAFFLAGQQLARLDRIEEARAALRDGIEHARAVGNAHAAGEMSEFLASLGALGE